MTSTQKNQELSSLRRSGRMVQHDWLSTMTQLKTNNLKALCELLCKPVSVTLTRLPISETEKHSKKVLGRIKLKRRRKTRILQPRETKENSTKVTKRLKKRRVPKPKSTEKVITPESKATRKRKLANSPETEGNLLRFVKQPRIKLQKIDKVINRIAQTFAKVISGKDVEANKTVQQFTEEIITETVLESVPSQLPSVFGSNENKNVKNNETQTTTPVNCLEDLRVFSSDENKTIRNSETRTTTPQNCVEDLRVLSNDENKTVRNSETQTSALENCWKNLPVFNNDESRSQQNNETQTSMPENCLEDLRVFSNVENKTARNSETQTSMPENYWKNLSVFNNHESRSQQNNETQTSVSENCVKDLLVFSNDENRSQQNNEMQTTLENRAENLPLFDNDENRSQQNNEVQVTSVSVPDISVNEETEDNDSDIFKMNSKRRRIGIISSDEESIVEQELDSQKEVTVTQQLDISEESYDSIDTLIDESSRETATEISDDEGREDCASIDVPLETRLTLISEDIYSHKNNRFRRPEESVSRCNPIQEKVKDPPISEKQLIEKYKLFKSLKIVLIKLDAMKASLSNSYSAKEIEQLTNRYINASLKSRFQHTLPRFSSETSSSINRDDVRRDVETITISDKSPSSSDDEVQETKKSPRSVSYRSSKSFMRALTSPRKIVRNLNFSNTENTVNKQRAHLLTKNSGIKSWSELPSPTSKEKTLRKLSHNENCKQTIINYPANRVRVIKLHLKPVSSSSLKFSKSNVSKCSAAALPASLPTKHKAANATHKCIVCDLCFGSYSLLQQHLPTHRQKQSVPIDTPSASNDSVVEILEIEKQKAVFSNSETDESSQSKKSSKASSKSSNKKKKTASENTSQSKRRKRIKTPKPNTVINNCDICSQIFSTNTDLTAHIFLHKERELQRARKNEKEMKEAEKTDALSSLEKSASPTEKEKCSELSIVQSNPSDKNSFVKETEANAVNAKSTVLTETMSKEAQQVKEKSKTKPLNKKRELIVCKCHNSSKISDNYLQIEIVLLCHTCRVLFRSLECFETHYRLSDSVLCNQNRLQSGRSPNLFCTTCGMVLSSVLELQRHLEQHERFYQNLTKDLRCNICKVVFIGVGSMFYNHWSKHAKDAFWVASEQSFPKLSIVKPNIQVKNNALGKAQTFIYVAEHICYDCRTPFANGEYLKKHKCNANKSANDAARKNQKHPKVRLVCNLCDGVYLERTEFYKHIREKHNFIAENEFVCVSLHTVERAFICTVCMDVSENINDFEEHWVQHSTNQPRFGCTFCKKDFETINWFLEHVKEHDPKQRDPVLTCFVSYRKAKFSCAHCNTGFESQKAFTEHSIYHRINVQTLQNKYANVLCQGSSASKSNSAPSLSKSKESIGEQKEKTPVVLELLTLQKKGVKDVEKEKLINILEGNDSDHELTIDLTEPLKKNSTQEKDNDGRQLVSVLEESTTETSAMFGNETDSHTEKVTDEYSQNSTSNVYQCENEQSLDNPNAEISAPANKEDLTMPKKSSSLKQGFLRVRDITELMDTSLHASNSCGQLEDDTSSTQHVSTPEAQETVTPLQQTTCAASFQQMLPATQIPQKIKIYAMQPSVINRSQHKQNFMSAYHKNLPACNIIQKSVVMPRSSVQKSDRVQAKTVMNSSNASMSASERPEVLTRTCSYQVDANENQKMNCNGNNAQPVCRVQQGSETRRMHNTVDNTTAVTASNATSQTYEQSQAKNASNDFPQCSNVATSSRSNQTHTPGQQMNQVQLGTPIYFNNGSSGGMSIVINQTTSTSSMPPGMPRQEQQRMHQPFVYGNPVPHVDRYLQQPQNMNNYSGLNSGVYMMPSNQGEVPVGGALTTYEVMMQAAEGLVCPYCPDAVPFMSEALLQLHVDSAHNYECDMCSQRFYSLSDLSLHRMKHRYARDIL